MPKVRTYVQNRTDEINRRLRDLTLELPEACVDFILYLEKTTQPLTRYVYTRDILLFLKYLIRENSRFANYTTDSFDYKDFDSITLKELHLFQSYLGYYRDENDVVYTNDNLGIMRKLCSLRSFYKFMYRNERIKQNVTEKLDLPKRHEKPIIRLEVDEMARMFDAVDEQDALTDHQKGFTEKTKKRDLAIITLFLGTGIRVSELVGIDIGDVDFELNAFTVTRKGGDQMILYFSDEVGMALQDYLEERKEIKAGEGHENALFLSMQRKRINVRSVENMVKKYARIAAPLKTKISPHKLRSTYGTNLYHETGDIYLVADVLGHKDVNTTRRHYAAMSDDKRRLAASAVKLRDEPVSQRSGNEDEDSPQQNP